MRPDVRGSHRSGFVTSSGASISLRSAGLATSLAKTAGGAGAALDHVYTVSGLYTVQVTARDAGHATSAPATLTVQVTNAPGPVPEGGSVTFSGPASDPDGNPLT